MVIEGIGGLLTRIAFGVRVHWVYPLGGLRLSHGHKNFDALKNARRRCDKVMCTYIAHSRFGSHEPFLHPYQICFKMLPQKNTNVNNQPKVAIIVPVYNVASYLRECLNSILTQTYTNFTVFAVDDGSTDESGAILDEYAATDTRIVAIHQKNAGQGAARNNALARIETLGTFDYVTFADGDDKVTTGSLTNSLKLQKGPVRTSPSARFITWKLMACTPTADFTKRWFSTKMPTSSSSYPLAHVPSTTGSSARGAWSGTSYSALAHYKVFDSSRVRTLWKTSYSASRSENAQRRTFTFLKSFTSTGSALIQTLSKIASTERCFWLELRPCRTRSPLAQSLSRQPLLSRPRSTISRDMRSSRLWIFTCISKRQLRLAMTATFARERSSASC